MTDRERAKDYIAIFIGAGDRWEFFIPVDADRTDDGIRLGTVEIGPDPEQPGAWLLRDGAKVTRYKATPIVDVELPKDTEVPA